MDKNISIDSISKEWSNKIPSGIIDLKNENHIYALSQVLSNVIDNPKVISGIIENVRKQTRENY
jgi:hypothetical protein